jgi:serine/threonine-protein kinase
MKRAGSVPGDNRTENWDKVDRAVKAFEDAWRFGKRPAIDDYLHAAGTERPALLRELALVDLERRLKAGQAARVEVYLKCFSELMTEPQGVLDLICLEYEQRRRKESEKTLRGELLGRFPAHRQALLAAFDRHQAEEESFTEIGQVPVLAAQARTATAVSQTVAELVTLLREGQFLKQVHLDKVTRDLQHRFGQTDKLLRELVRWGWLTPYQAEAMAQGRGPGLLVGPYVLLEPLGAGGMGQVFKARHRLMNRLAAVKLIRPEARSSPDFLQRFLREVEAAAQLAHPNIVAAFDAAQYGATLYLAMEYVPGMDLGRLLKAHGPLPVDRACDYVRQAALGLQHAHERGLIHRDIKPSNLLVAIEDRGSGMEDRGLKIEDRRSKIADRSSIRNPRSSIPLSGTIKLLDLGLARLQLDTGDERRRLTQEGEVMGTPDYMAPEQVLDSRQADIRSDIYALGCTLYHLLAGQPPFPTGSIVEKLLAHQKNEPIAVEQLRPDIPPALAPVVRRMLAKRPDSRYQTPGQVAAALAPFCPGPTATAVELPLQAIPVAAVRATATASRRRRWLWPAVAAGATAVLVMAVIFWSNGKGSDPIDPEESPPVVVNLLDRLKPADIPFKFRWQGQPKELVAILGATSPHKGHVSCVVFSPDGKYLLSACNDLEKSAEVRLWNLETLQPVYHVDFGETVTCIAVTRDGKRAAAMGFRPQLLAWDLATGKELFRQNGWRVCYDLHFSPDGRWLLGDENPDWNIVPLEARNPGGNVLILNGQTGEKHATFHERKSPFLRSIQVFKDGKTAVCATIKHLSAEPAGIFFFDVPSGKPIKSWTYKEGGFMQIRLSPDNRYLYGSHEKDGHLWIWDLKQPKPEPIRKPASKTAIHSMALSRDGNTLLTYAPADFELVEWTVPVGNKGPTWKLPSISYHLQVIAMAPDGRHIAVGRGDGCILILRLKERVDVRAGA